MSPSIDCPPDAGTPDPGRTMDASGVEAKELDHELALAREQISRSLFPLGSVLEVRIGRFVVERRLGAGAMGVVYAARDPALDRRVAIKLVRPEVGGDRKAQLRLEREARALAKVSHPNIVAIHEVGEHKGLLFLAMEHVQGMTLRAWQERKWRSRSAVVAMYLQAGLGLAAAHAAGLVHRDFKPDNVLVDDEGRARVVDFGLVSADAEAWRAELSRWQASADRSMTLLTTHTHALIGTPAYMSTEQWRGEAVDARSDQFAFCVALWEALYGERPFEGQSLLELSEQVLRGKIRASRKGRSVSSGPSPGGTKVPVALRRVLLRGLAVQARDRWPSMDALLAELRRLAAPRGLRWVALGLTGALAVAGTGLVASRYVEVMHRCQGAVEQLAGIWDDARRQELKAAILGTELSYAADTWTRVEQRLDEYARSWTDKHTEVCEATSVRQEQSTEAMDLRMECLRDRRVELREAVGVLSVADPTRVKKAVELVAGLRRLARCDDVEALRAELPPPEDPQVAAKVEALREQLVHVRTLAEAGVYDEALAEAEVVVEQAEGLAYVPLLAEALFERGHMRAMAGQYAEAEQDAERAYLLAAEHGHDGVEAKVASALIGLVGARQARHEAGLQWGKTALAKGRRFNPEVEALALDNIGGVLRVQGVLEEALIHHQRALAIREEALGPRHPEVAMSLNNIGAVLSDQGKLEDALTYLQRALAIREEALGPRHPKVASSLNNIGAALSDQGKLENGLIYLQRGLAIQEEAFGPLHPEVATSLGNIGVALSGQGKLEDALTYLHRGLAIFEEALGPRHPNVADWLDNIGAVLLKQGKLEDALTHHQRALAIYEEALGPRHPNVVPVLGNIGLVLAAQGKLEDARTHVQRTLAISEEALGPLHPHVAHALVDLAKVELLMHDPDAAREHAERAVSIREASETSPDPLAEARFVLARALWSDQEQRVRSRALAEQARDAYTDRGAANQEDLAEVQAWLRRVNSGEEDAEKK